MCAVAAVRLLLLAGQVSFVIFAVSSPAEFFPKEVLTAIHHLMDIHARRWPSRQHIIPPQPELGIAVATVAGHIRLSFFSLSRVCVCILHDDKKPSSTWRSSIFFSVSSLFFFNLSTCLLRFVLMENK
jgi:hypothetical protein